MKNKRGQMKMSFGMIFSIILIVIFIITAFYAIQKFLGFQEEIQINQFIDSLKSDVDKMWRGSKGSQEVEYSLPTKVKRACFVESDYENFVIKNKEGFILMRTTIENIDILEILDGDMESCFEIEHNKISVILKKDFGQTLVNIIQN